MGRLSDLMENRRGGFRAYFAGMDHGELAASPEIRADYETGNIAVLDEVCGTRTVEGEPEVNALIKLPLKAVRRMLILLSDLPAESGELRLTNHAPSGDLTLVFPQSRLLPVWEFIPSQTGDHRITVRFSAVSDSEGELFYC